MEGAFYRLPEILFGSFQPRHQYEATLAGHYAMALLLELNSRNIEAPQGRIHLEYPYSLDSPQRIHRVDLHVDLRGVLPGPVGLQPYGVLDRNWIEAKYFVARARTDRTQDKSRNAANIAQDVLRLCLNTVEERSSTRHNGRYLLGVFNREPSEYLPRAGAVEWLRGLLQAGTRTIAIKPRGASYDLEVETTTYAFEPLRPEAIGYYWGYLVRIRRYTVAAGELRLEYSDFSKEMWSEEKVRTQAALAQRLLRASRLRT